MQGHTVVDAQGYTVGGAGARYKAKVSGSRSYSFNPLCPVASHRQADPRPMNGVAQTAGPSV